MPPTAEHETTTAADDFIDDVAFQAHIHQQMTAAVDAGRLIPLKVLQREARTALAQAVHLPTPRTTPLGDEDLYPACRDSVVVVAGLYHCGKCAQWHTTISSGFVLTADGVVVTNHHVLFPSSSCEHIAVVTRDGRCHPIRAIIADQAHEDISLLQIEGSGFTPLPLQDHTPVGARIAVLGHINGAIYSLTEGIVSRYCVQRTVRQMIVTADWAKGSSGSPILDRNGNAVGMVKSTHQIYYDERKDGTRDNLQMVIKQGVPAVAIREVLTAPGTGSPLPPPAP